MAPADELAFEGEHHFIKVRFRGKVRAHLDSKVPGAFTVRDSFETLSFSPLPCPFLLAGPNHC
jgi:hypothetical protein